MRGVAEVLWIAADWHDPGNADLELKAAYRLPACCIVTRRFVVWE